jgi:hypothetical protein
MIRSSLVSAPAAQILSLLILLGALSSVQAQGQSIVIRDFDDSGSGFSFQRGTLVRPENPQALSLNVDFILDLPHGIGANSSKLSKKFKGRGGIIDMGRKPLAEVTDAPKSGYKPALETSDIKVGHTYYVLTADGRHHGKLHVTAFDVTKKTLTFTWQYQPK